MQQNSVLSTVTLLCIGISVIIPPLYVEAQAQLKIPGVNFQETHWEKQLETGLIALEANCDVNSVPFNREKVREDLKVCLESIIAQETTYVLTPNKPLSQVEIFRHFYIEPICNKVSQSLSCLKPHKKIIENCAREDGKALQGIMRLACKANGTRLVEFIEEGGIDCISEHREELATCFNELAERKNNTMNLQSSDQICGFFGEARDCIFNALFKCDRKRPGQIIHDLLEDVVAETSGSCLKSRANELLSAAAAWRPGSENLLLIPVLSILSSIYLFTS